jgi:hypothetical protein
LFVIKASDGTLYGPFELCDGAQEWAERNEEWLGDWCGEELFPPAKETDE